MNKPNSSNSKSSPNPLSLLRKKRQETGANYFSVVSKLVQTRTKTSYATCEKVIMLDQFQDKNFLFMFVCAQSKVNREGFNLISSIKLGKELSADEQIMLDNLKNSKGYSNAKALAKSFDQKIDESVLLAHAYDSYTAEEDGAETQLLSSQVVGLTFTDSNDGKAMYFKSITDLQEIIASRASQIDSVVIEEYPWLLTLEDLTDIGLTKTAIKDIQKMEDAEIIRDTALKLFEQRPARETQVSTSGVYSLFKDTPRVCRDKAINRAMARNEMVAKNNAKIEQETQELYNDLA